MSAGAALVADYNVATLVAMDRVQLACSRLGVRIDSLTSVASVTDYVFRGTLDGAPVIAKCSMLGMSRGSLDRHIQRFGFDAQTLAEAAEAWAAGGGMALDGTAFLMTDLLPPGRVRIPQVHAADRDVLVIEEVTGGRPLSTHVASDLPAILTSLWDGISHIWAVSTAGADLPRGLNEAHRRSILATFARKVGSHGVRQYVGSCVDDPFLVDALARLGNMLLLVHTAPKVSPRLVYGDLKPEHVLVDEKGQIVLIDNALHIDVPAQDVARFLLRSALAGRDDLLVPHPAWSARVSLHHVAQLMALDWFNITTTRFSAPWNAVVHRSLPVAALMAVMLDAALGCIDGIDAARRVSSLVAKGLQ